MVKIEQALISLIPMAMPNAYLFYIINASLGMGGAEEKMRWVWHTWMS
jgi:hypothetical protein